MAASFTGTFDQKVDSKARMSIPADLRRVLELGDDEFATTQAARMKIVYGRHLKGHLQAYTMNDFEKIAANIMAMKRGSVERRMASQMILAASATVYLDRDGRVVLPKAQRDQIGLDREVLYVGMGEYFEIWPTADQDDHFDELDAFLAQQGDGFDVLSLVPDRDVSAGDEA